MVQDNKRRNIQNIIEKCKRSDLLKDFFNDDGDYPIFETLVVSDEMLDELKKMKLIKIL